MLRVDACYAHLASHYITSRGKAIELVALQAAVVTVAVVVVVAVSTVWDHLQLLSDHR